jgi:LCP family protein required for cell wall assembly
VTEVQPPHDDEPIVGDDTLNQLSVLRPDPAPKRRRTWAQRFVLGVNVFAVVACFGAAIGIFYGNEKANDRRVVSIIGAEGGPTLTLPSTTVALNEDGSTASTEAPVVVDVTAKNFLITGSDNGACVDPDSPYAAAFGNRNGLGERADTIMILRLDPTTNAAAVLSFPRDMWVRIGGTKRMGRINSAFNADDPNTLILTIWDNFGILADHYVNIDFCAFKQIVDAVGGVRVPFATPVRDRHTNLLIETAGCHTFSGEEGLAYVRSRHFQYFDPKKKEWVEDPASDRGRISRQQDFLRRAIQMALDKSAGSPAVAKQLIDAGIQNVILDANLTPGKLLELASAMKNLNPTTMRTYQVEGRGVDKSGQSVLEPLLKSDSMKAVLAVFQGKARLVDAPEQLFEVATTTVAPATTAAPGGTSKPGATTTTSSLVPVYVDENTYGVLPPDDPACR